MKLHFKRIVTLLSDLVYLWFRDNKLGCAQNELIISRQKCQGSSLCRDSQVKQTPQGTKKRTTLSYFNGLQSVHFKRNPACFCFQLYSRNLRSTKSENKVFSSFKVKNWWVLLIVLAKLIDVKVVNQHPLFMTPYFL